MKAALLLLLPAAALAHDMSHMPPEKGAPVIVTPKTDPDKRSVPMVIVPEKGEDMDHASMHAIPLGSGPAADGGAWLRIDVTGTYCVHNAKVIGFPNGCPMTMEGNRVYRVLPHKGPLIWTTPDGAQGVVPDSQQIAPKSSY